MPKKIIRVLLFLLLLFFPSQLAWHFWPSWAIVNNFRVDYLSPTIYFSDLIVFSIIFLSLKQKTTSFPNLFSNNLSKTFVFLIFTNIIFSYHPLLSFIKIFRIFLYLWLLLILLKNQNIYASIFSKTFPFTAIWVSTIGISQFLFKSNLGGLFYFLGERPLSLQMLNIGKISLGNFGEFIRSPSVFPHANALAGFLVISILLIIRLWQKKQIKSSIFFISMVLTLIALIFTFSRSALFSLLVASLVTARKRNNQKYLYFIIIPIIIFLALYLLKINFGFLTSPSVAQRNLLLFGSFKNLLSSPLFGIGFGTYPYFSKYIFQPVHNIYLLVLVEVGAVAFFVLLKLLLSLKNHKSKLMSGVLTIILITGSLDHYWISSVQNLLLLFIIFPIIKFYESS
jgi:hypothetical protein